MNTYLKLKKSNCKNCYKCIRNCPVKSIKFADGQANIISDECILCGQCLVVCPQNAKEIRSDAYKAKEFIKNGEKVVVSIAPAFAANFKGASISNIETALKKLGFYSVEETALGATVVKKKYDEMIIKGEQDVIISSCCPTVNTLIQKYYPEALKYLAKVLTPMQTHGKMIKEKEPEAKVVFIGPCVSKKYEGDSADSYIDCVLTFEELAEWLEEENVKIEVSAEQAQGGKAAFFPTVGGILKSMDCDKSYEYITVDGIDNCISIIKDVLQNKLTKCFIEISACKGSCVGGPAKLTENHSSIIDTIAVNKYAGDVDYDVKNTEVDTEYAFIGTNRVMPGEAKINEILLEMGKRNKSDELNCGACGYNTCREKAIAVYFGKAELTMCLPFLTEKAESFSDTIIKNTPNAIIVLNEDLLIQQINSAAMKVFGIKYTSEIVGEQVIRILDPKPFLDVLDSGKARMEEKVYLARYDRYVEQTVLYDRHYHIVICLMRDVTDEENARIKKEKLSHDTIDVTDRVVEKQMRVVQEIASLLGETAAETKIALTKLKDSLKDE
ncbi:MAG: [Fe-Fe] hydrogenase large subunit C-terminal domain-containing protein [Clostridia bacterium]